MSYHPIVVTLSSLKPFFFNGLKKELCCLDHAWSIRPRNPIRALLLQRRVKTLDGELGVIFKRWYPDMDLEVDEMPVAA